MQSNLLKREDGFEPIWFLTRINVTVFWRLSLLVAHFKCFKSELEKLSRESIFKGIGQCFLGNMLIHFLAMSYIRRLIPLMSIC